LGLLHQSIKKSNAWGLVLSDFRKCWVGLNMVKGIGAVHLRALLNAFGVAQSAWQASPEELLAVGLIAKITENLIKLRTSISLDEVWERLQSQDIQVLTWDDDTYPIRFAH